MLVHVTKDICVVVESAINDGPYSAYESVRKQCLT